MKKPSLLYIITQGQWGGAQRSVFDLAVRFKDEFDVTVAVGDTKAPSDLQQKLHSLDIKTIQLEHLIRSIDPFRDWKALKEVEGLYNTIQPDIVHLHSSKAGLVGSIAAKKIIPNVPVVYTVHGWVFLEPLGIIKKQLYILLESWSSFAKKKVICLSEKDRQVGIKELGISEKKIVTIPNGIRPPSFLLREEARQKLIPKFLPDAYLIGCVANFYKTKGHEILLDAFSQFQKNASNAQLILIGDGPERKNIEQKIKEKNLFESVHLLGQKENSAQYMKAFDIAVLSSVKEGLPYALIEARMAEVPVIATTVGGIPEMIEHEKTGLLVPPNSVTELISAFKTAFSQPEKMKAFARNAFMEKDKWTIDHMVEKTRALYHSLLTSAINQEQSHE